LSGTYAVTLVNGSTNNRAYVMSYTLTANTPSLQTFLIPGDTGGTWTLTGTNYGLVVVFPFSSGTSNQTSTFNTWGSGSAITGASGQVQVTDNTSAVCHLTNVKLSPSTRPTVFVARNLAEELTLDQRYYVKTFPQGTKPAQSAGVAGSLCVQNPIANGQPSIYWPFIAPMVSSPSITTYNPSASNANWRDVTAGADVTVSVDPSSAKSVSGVEIATGATVTTLADSLCIQASADSRL
jgi:hypothetical protein